MVPVGVHGPTVAEVPPPGAGFFTVIR